MRGRITIEPARGDLDPIRLLFAEYAKSLPFDLAFQQFDAELVGLPGKYAPPDGLLLLARAGEKTAGCVALRRFDATRCEMKRLFVRDAFRGLGIGKLLATTVVAEATRMGYAAMLLDTLESMPEALALYKKMGFREIKAYCHNPQPDAVYLEKTLRPNEAARR